jgi:pilus assembly protein CpaB
MRAIFALVLLVGMALAGMAVYMIQGYMAETEKALLQQEQAFNAKAGKLVEVYVFAKPLQYGDALTEEDVQLIYWPEKPCRNRSSATRPCSSPKTRRARATSCATTEAFEPVLASRVTEPGELASLTAKLEKGMRAFAIKVGWIQASRTSSSRTTTSTSYWTGDVAGSRAA